MRNVRQSLTGSFPGANMRSRNQKFGGASPVHLASALQTCEEIHEHTAKWGSFAARHPALDRNRDFCAKRFGGFEARV